LQYILIYALVFTLSHAVEVKENFFIAQILKRFTCSIWTVPRGEGKGKPKVQLKAVHEGPEAE